MPKCTATKRDGTSCNAWAVKDSDPPRCAAHGGTHQRIGAPPGNTNARTHGYYATSPPPSSSIADPEDNNSGSEINISDIIADLAAKQQSLSRYIDGVLKNTDNASDVKAIAHLLALHGQNASRLGRLLRDQRALSGDAADGIAGAIAQALDELSTELGVEL